MPRFVLPTSEIIYNLADCEELFDFYDDGLRAVVRDMLLLNGGNLSPVLPLYSEDPDTNLGAFRQQLLEDYDRTVNVRAMEDTLTEYRALRLEYAITLIDTEITRMLKAYFRNHCYEICQDSWKWLGNDLVVRLAIHA